MHVVDFPEPPFSFPSTITCADLGYPTEASNNITRPSPLSFFMRRKQNVKTLRSEPDESWLSFLVNPAMENRHSLCYVSAPLAGDGTAR
jgi:hypothetical protein